MLHSQMKLFAGNSNPDIAKRISKYLDIPISEMDVDRFSDGEVRIKINENVRGRDVFIVQSTCSPVNENTMELLIIIDAMKRASADRITAVIPYFGYARQDRKDQPRVPITARLIANLLTAAGADRVLTMDLHAGQIQGFFDIPLDHLFAAPVIIKYIQKLNIDNIAVVSPDVGGIKRARALCRHLNAGLAVVDKRRISGKKIEVMNVMGDVKGKKVFIVDDVVATAGSLLEAVSAVKERGALDVYACIVHPVLSGTDVLKRIEASPLVKFVITDTIPIRDKRDSSKIEVLTVSGLLGEAIKRIHNNESVSSLFV